jgi:hypothetical protein
VRWIPTGSSEVDVVKFRDAVAAGNLEVAAGVYSGDLLPACYDDWVLDERAKLRAEVHAVLVRLAQESVGRHDHEETIRHCQRIIDLEPTDEAAVRMQMAAHLARGERGAALRAYHRYAAALERDLAVEPAEAIAALYREIRESTPSREPLQVRLTRATPTTCRSSSSAGALPVWAMPMVRRMPASVRLSLSRPAHYCRWITAPDLAEIFRRVQRVLEQRHGVGRTRHRNRHVEPRRDYARVAHRA